MSLSTVKYNVYSALHIPGCNATADSDVIQHEAMFNLVQSTYVILQSTTSLHEEGQETLMNGQHAFQVLFTRCFKESMKV